MPGAAGFYPVSLPSSPPPPQSLTTYSRFMHDHTKRQMESFGAIRSSSSSHSTSHASNTANAMANGAASATYNP
ncbi:hypothetical protein L249_4520 [Ophiocordyceps polyrhachis-furcata BCC 54312]|uniref:Uncharacterized protein n=1 Tax=Ophiocordyceps polyrhachis-furcata BCC 54312 TaxID=1330021 RepID=A0A367KZ58_9HYPO|nr:hypothetical protein L249_4520 [Ophiocordyceps polyrhachis-furcata BCC 54312]